MRKTGGVIDMGKSVQLQDLLELLSRRGKKGKGRSMFYRKEEDLAYIFSSLTDRKLSGSDISKAKSGKDSFTVRSIDATFDALFAERPDVFDPEEDEEQMLLWFMEYVKLEDLWFPGCEGRKDDTYEAYVKRFLTQVFTPAPEQTVFSSQDRSTQNGPTTSLSKGSLLPQFFSKKPYFIGRESILSEMEEHLRDSHIVVLSGVGGIGKSYLSEEYAGRHKGDYDLLQQIKFSADNQVKSFQELIMHLSFDGLNERELPDSVRYKMRLKLLKNSQAKTLLLLDSMDTPWDRAEGKAGIDKLAEFVRNAGNDGPRMIITTRLTEEFNAFPVIRVSPMTEEEQLSLFSYHLGGPVAQREKTAVEELFRRIGGHTLLIELSARSVRAGGLKISEVLDCLSGNTDIYQPDIVFQKDGQQQTTISSYVRDILFRINLPKEEEDVLRQLALLPAEGVSKRLVVQKLCSMRYVDALEKKGWIEARSAVREEDGEEVQIILLHPVIQEVVRQTLRPAYDICKPFFDKLGACFFLGDSGDDGYEMDLCRLCRSLSDSNAFETCLSEEASRFLCQMAEFYQDKAEYDYNTIEKIYVLRLCILEKLMLVPSEQCAKLCIEIGKTYQQHGEYDAAVSYFRRAEQYAREDRSLQYQVYLKLGEIFRKKSGYEQARKYFEQASDFAAEDHDKALLKNATGVLCINRAEAEKVSREQALELYEQALELYSAAKDI